MSEGSGGIGTVVILTGDGGRKPPQGSDPATGTPWGRFASRRATKGRPVADEELIRSPLHDRHVAAGAKFAAFSGWSMPLEYAGAGVLAEHAGVRQAVGIFDVSHLGKAEVTGPGAADFVNRCLTNDLGRIGPGQAQYTLLCNDDGGVVDDLIAYLRSPDDVLLIPNAANCAEVVARLAEAAPPEVRVTNRHRDFAILAVQGTHSDEVLSAAGLPIGHDYMSFATAELAGTPLTVCRTGYTGERGYELVVPAEAAGAVWDAVTAAGEPYGLQPAGLGARDTLAHRDGLRPARPRAVADHHPGAGPAGLGDRLDQGHLLRPRGAAGGEAGRADPAAARPEGRRAGGSPGPAWWSATRTAGSWVRSPPAPSPRRSRPGSRWPWSTPAWRWTTRSPSTSAAGPSRSWWSSRRSSRPGVREP